MSNLKSALIVELLWTQSRGHGAVSPQTKLPAPKIEVWNTINQRSCQFSECQAPLWKTFWTVYWNIYESIRSYLKQPVSLLGFNTAQSWKSLLWPGCGNWNGQYIAAILVVSSTILAHHGLYLTSETMRLLKCSKVSKINSITDPELLRWGRKVNHYGQCGRSKFTRKLFFDSLSLLSKRNKSDVCAQLPC